MAVSSPQVQKLRRGAAFARGACSLLLLVMVAGVLFASYSVVTPTTWHSTRYSVGGFVIEASDMANPRTQAWLLANFWALFAIGSACVWRLRRLFVDLARGEIFTRTNVLTLRRVAKLIFLAGAYGFAGPLITRALIGPTGASTVGVTSFFLPWQPFATGGLLLLASWIMEVGLGVREDADELRRDVELTV